MTIARSDDERSCFDLHPISQLSQGKKKVGMGCEPRIPTAYSLLPTPNSIKDRETEASLRALGSASES